MFAGRHLPGNAGAAIVVAGFRRHPGHPGYYRTAGQDLAHGGVAAGGRRHCLARATPAAAPWSGRRRGGGRGVGRARRKIQSPRKGPAMISGDDLYVLGANGLLTLCRFLARSGYFLFGDYLPLTEPVRSAFRYAPTAGLIGIGLPAILNGRSVVEGKRL